MPVNPSASGEARPGAARRAGRAAGRLRDFWQRVTEGIQISDLWAQFRSEARTSYGLYAREVDWEEIQKKRRWRRPFHAAWALFLAMLMKLSPARRILLLAAAVLLLYPLPALFVLSFESDRIAAAADVKFFALGAALLFLLLALELADRVTMKRDLEIAREIQRWLVPEKAPELEGLDLAFLSRPANTVAGDYYDVIPRGAARGGRASGNPLLLVVADVAGKSVPAALLMATFQASLRAIEAGGTALPEIMRNLNYYVCENSQNGLRFITAFFAEYHLASGEISYTCAGHHPALVRRSSGQVEELSVGGLPLGIETDAEFPIARTALAPGEMLFIYTDGLVEAVDPAGREFGRARLTDVVRPADGAEPAAQVLSRVARVLDGFVGAARQHDDVTCMIVRRLPTQ
jgi:serine phosphatase RsbU (regulator of sigma subunit)